MTPTPPPDPWAAAGFGRDPDGDAARRAAMGTRRLADGTTVAGVPDHALPAVEERLAELDGYGLPAARAQAAARAELHPPAEVEPLPAIAGHTPEHGEHDGIGWVRCSCGTWDAIVTGPASAAWARRDYDRHLAEVRP